MTAGNSTQQRVPCRACHQPIHFQAKKCQHCGELQVKPFSLEQQIKRVVGWIGFFTAFLSLFYLLQEGYYFLEQRQQKREMFAAHLSVAEQFLKLDNLEYAEASLQQALQLNPGHLDLRLQYFRLRSHKLLRAVDYYRLQLSDDQLAIIPELVTSGFSLLEDELPAEKRALLLISLARLLEHDRQ